MTEKDRPQLPPPAWYTLEDVAQRWRCKIEQVIHYAEADMLRISLRRYVNGNFFLMKPITDSDGRVIDPQRFRAFLQEDSGGPHGVPSNAIRSIFSDEDYILRDVCPPVISENESTSDEINHLHCSVGAKAEDLVIVRDEIDRFEREYRIGAHAGELPAPDSLTKWPWGEHETKLLRTLAGAAKRFWVNYAPGEPDTAPTNAAVVQFLEKSGVSGNIAQAMATILRADDLPAGRKKVEP